jgi:hypothetical protein
MLAMGGLGLPFAFRDLIRGPQPFYPLRSHGADRSPVAAANGNQMPTPLPGRSFQLGAVAQTSGALQIDQAADGVPLTIAGVPFPSGLGARVHSRVQLLLKPGTHTLSGSCGIDDSETDPSSIGIFRIWGGDRWLWEGTPMKKGMPAQSFQVDVSNLPQVDLIALVGGTSRLPYLLGDWVNLKAE